MITPETNVLEARHGRLSEGMVSGPLGRLSVPYPVKH